MKKLKRMNAEPLTLESLNKVEPETIFATDIGYTTNSPNSGPFFQIFPWVAERGVIDDWAIYYLPNGNGIKRTSRVGHKLKHPEAIKRLVPCTEKALARYRFE